MQVAIDCDLMAVVAAIISIVAVFGFSGLGYLKGKLMGFP
jgi:hypothetical protein